MAELAPAEDARIVAKAAWRIIPFLTFCFFLAFLDRVNIGFASLQMNRALHISPAAFGLAGGLFFVSYFIFEVPSNLMVERFGARIWLARIMIVWGLVATLMAFTRGPAMFLVLRFLLGAAEAGFFPCVLLYLTRWFPRAYRARFIGWFTVAIPLSGVFGSPLSALLLQFPHVGGLAGWQWLFVLEGVPSVLAGLACLVILADGPATAPWLSPAERARLQAMFAADETQAPPVAPERSLLTVLFSRDVLWLAIILSGAAGASAAYGVWLPRVISLYHLAPAMTGYAVASMYLLAAVAMVLLARLSDRAGERRWHTAAPLFLAAVCCVLFLAGGRFLFVYAMLALSLAGFYASKGPSLALVTEILPADGRAAAIAQVNALANLTGFFTVSLIGWMFQRTHSYAVAFLPVGALCAVAGVAALRRGGGGMSATGEAARVNPGAASPISSPAGRAGAARGG